ncbi:MAG: hypothetical protein Barrevirus14_2 [Barrevirus sp.]|uniref:Uncharacterized protein n=1 Tax=Barrevirus sp. TaxID=2487763 RepID=A0A3G4ZU66_9VIRU|nr:MAG: hypothetical protein Barrevirus14_2 [Barrevirus sp.]
MDNDYDLEWSFSTLILPTNPIKNPSKFIPKITVINRIEAIRSGGKTGTGSSIMHKFNTKIKEFFGFLPKEKTGKLVTLIHHCRNELRSLNQNINTLLDLFNNIMDNKSIHLEKKEKQEIVLTTIFFLKTCYKNLAIILVNLKMYQGLLKADAKIGTNGYLVAGKGLYDELDPYLKIKEAARQVEYSLLERVANDISILTYCFDRLSELNLSSDDYEIWANLNSKRIEASLNSYKGLGNMIGVIIHGLIIAGINFGIGIGTANPPVIVAGSYYLVSTIFRVIRIGMKTYYENKLILGQNKCNKVTYFKIKIITVATTINNFLDGFANTIFGVLTVLFHIPISTIRPASSYPEPMKI